MKKTVIFELFEIDSFSCWLATLLISKSAIIEGSGVDLISWNPLYVSQSDFIGPSALATAVFIHKFPALVEPYM